MVGGVGGLRASGGEEQGSGGMVEKVKAEAQDALSFVGWADGREEGDEGPVIRREDIADMVARAVAEEEFADDRSREMFEQDTFDKLLKEVVRQEIKADYGVELENLLNPIKVVSLNKKIIEAEKALAGDSMPAAERAETEEKLLTFRADLDKERRSVMMDWLKTVFRSQAAFSLVGGALLATDHMPGFPDLPIAARAFGFWTMWLFTIPSLRAVKPMGYPQWNVSGAQEKKALNLAFVLTPLTTIGLPFLTKDPSLIFDANLVAVALCYAFYVVQGPGEDSDPGVEVKGLLKYLDYGSGRERGVRK